MVVLEARVRHAERLEELFVSEGRQRLTGRPLDQDPEQEVPRVAVQVALPGRKVESTLSREQLQRLARGSESIGSPPGQQGELVVVPDPARVVHEVPRRNDSLGIFRQLWDEHADVGVQIEPSALRQDRDRHGGELLRHGAERKAVEAVLGIRCSTLAIPKPRAYTISPSTYTPSTPPGPSATSWASMISSTRRAGPPTFVPLTNRAP